MAMLIAALCAEGTSTIGNIRPDRPRLRAHRRAPARARRRDRAHRAVTNAGRREHRSRRTRTAEVATGRRRPRPPARGACRGGRVRAQRSRSRPTRPRRRSARAGEALGDALAPLLHEHGARGRGFGIAPADEALAMVVVEASGRPLVVSNADLTSTRAGGLQTDLAADVPRRAGERRRAHDPRAADRGRELAARPVRDLQGARHRARAAPDERRASSGRERRHPHRPGTRAVPGRPYNQAIRVGDLVFVAGQLGISLETGALAGAGVAEQTEQIMANLGAILEAAGSGLDKLVKTTVFLMDLGDFAGDERGLRDDTSAIGRRRARRSQISGFRAARSSRSRRSRTSELMTGTASADPASPGRPDSRRAEPNSAIPTAE